MQHSSQAEQDAVQWSIAPLPLGANGLDLRTPAAPGSLTKLLNARFRDEQTLDRRNGYRSLTIQDGGEYLGAPTGWVYGFGQTSITDHHPEARVGRGMFRFDDTDVVWTGDRLLSARADASFLGESTFWGRGSGSEPWGIPAYLPVQTEILSPDVITGNYIETCLTEDVRVIVASTSSEGLEAWVVDRTTGSLINHSTLHSGTSIREPRVVNSGGYPVAIWRDNGTLYLSWWSGVEWTIASSITTCDAHDVYPRPDATGFYILWRDTGVLKKAEYAGYSPNTTHVTFGTTVSTGHTSTGAFAFAVTIDRGVVVAFQDSGLYVYSDNTGSSALVDSDVGPYNSGISVCMRRTPDGVEDNRWMVHAGNNDVYVRVAELAEDNTILQTTKRYNCHLASKAFLVGNEVFCWLRTRNSETNFLLAGVTKAQFCGVADREEAVTRIVNSGVKSISMVAPDPLDDYAFTWARPYTTSRTITIDDDTSVFDETYKRAGNARVGDLQFLPQMSAVQFGKSFYLSGSLVRNWDGVELGDAGFQDYPVIKTATIVAGGSDGLLSTGGIYYFRVYAVRYNKCGERFQSPAITQDAGSISAGQHISFSIQTLPCTNHDDVTFEVYRTEAGGTTFYLDGTVANDLNAQYVTYTSTQADSTLRQQLGDPHQPGVGITGELEEMGPIGCSLLMAAGDRLWGAGGQVPSGTVQFSKLKEPGEGAGFDAIAGTQEIDVQGAPITSMTAFGEARVFFQEQGFQVITNDGPDNYGNGSFGVPQMILADGATTHRGTIQTPIGPVYWGADGPRLLGGNFQVDQICAPIRELSRDMTPTGVQVDLSRQEVIWFTDDGTALLWNFQRVETKFGQLTSIGRWAQWRLPEIAAASQYALLTTDGRLLYEDEDVQGDGGAPFEYAGATGYIAPGSVLGGHTHVRGVGVVGQYLGPHELRLKVFYDGADMWTDRWIWEPATDTGLQTCDDLGSLTPAQIDALNLVDVSGQYATHKRTSVHECRHFRVDWSDMGSLRPTYRLHELTLELGARGGFGRVPVNTFR